MPTVRPETTQLITIFTAVPKPETAVPGDLLLAFVTTESSTFDLTLTGGAPEWQLLTSKTTANGSGETTQGIISTGIWWKPAGVGETGWTLSESPSQYCIAAVVAISGAHLGAPEFTESADQTSFSLITSVTSPAGPPAVVGDLELRWVSGDEYTSSSVRTWLPPGSTTEVVDLSDRYVTAQLTRQTLTSAATVTRSHTVGPAGVYAAHGITLRIPPPDLGRPLSLSPAAAVHRASTW